MFESARLKIEWANQHIDRLEAEFKAYIATKPHRFRIYHDPQSGRPTIRIQFVKQPPKVLALIIGDAIHNIRTALDHMTWEAIGIDGGTQDRNLSFPSGDCRISFEASCKGIKTPSDWVKDLFIDLEIFPTGKGHPLYTLKQFDNIDKHSTLVPLVRATTVPSYTIFDPNGGVRVRMENASFASGIGDYFNIMDIPPGHSLELDQNADCAPIIVFDNTQGPAGPVIPTLEQFAQLASGIIDSFKTAFT